MEQIEYKNRMKEIEKSFNDAKTKLYKEYAASHRKFNIGDVIRDHSDTILVEAFGTSKVLDLPEPTYIGKALKKDLTPKKSGEYATIYGNNGVELVKPANSLKTIK